MVAEESLRADTVLAYLERAQGARCVDCGATLCGHAGVMSLAMGFKNAPRCLGCLAIGLGRHPEELRDHLYTYLDHQECFRAGWRWASRQEGFDPAVAPACLWPASTYHPAVGSSPGASDTIGEGSPDVEWDAGDMRCGDLVLELRLRLQPMDPGTIMKITARDRGAPADLPAWCRLTGHTLVQADHPEYWIRRKEK